MPWFDNMRNAGEYPRKGYGWQSEEEQRVEIQRKINNGYDMPWVLKEARKFGITRQEVDTTKGY